LAQLERLDELVERRVKSAAILRDVMTSCDYLIPQYVPHDYINSYYTLGVKYVGDRYIGVSWCDFRKKYIENGGDGIYGACAIPYTEPALADRPYYVCETAEFFQPRLMQFKTNYRDMDLAAVKAAALEKTIKGFR
jgi:dTDP-4-amino-4,6-dideoxygalactose transaminase